jgi:hypothetical protein
LYTVLECILLEIFLMTGTLSSLSKGIQCWNPLEREDKFKNP